MIEPSARLGTIPISHRWSPEAYDAAAARNLRVYKRGYEQRAIHDEELLFPSWTQLRDHHRGQKIADLLGGARKGRDGWFSRWRRFVGVDLSSEHRPGNLIVTLAASRAKDGRSPLQFCPLEVHGGRLADHWTHPQVVDHLDGVFRRWDPDLILVESNAQQDQLIRWGERLGKDWTRRVQGFQTTARKHDEYLGLPGFEVEWSQAAWLIPYGEWENDPPGCDCGWCELDRQIASWTRDGPSEGSGDHLMGLYFAWEAARQQTGAAHWANVDLGRG